MSSPHDQSYTMVNGVDGAERWYGPGYDWQPGGVSDDPHDVPYGDSLNFGEVPENIHDGGPGPISSSRQ
jgi:hypothetical protein